MKVAHINFVGIVVGHNGRREKKSRPVLMQICIKFNTIKIGK